VEEAKSVEWPELKWTSKKEWGPVGLTHRCEVTIGGVEHSFCVDQPRKGYWVARGWRGGPSFMYREAASLAGAKREVIKRVIELTNEMKGESK